jgi:plastocyanin
MRQTFPIASRCLASCLLLALGCSPGAKKADQSPLPSLPPAFHVDLNTAGSISGVIRYTGKRPAAKKIDMSEDPACVEAHHGKAFDESLVVSPNGSLANAFIYVKQGLEGKRFEVPSTPVTIDQNGCWFHPRVLGIQVGQQLQVTNSDPVTHNIHPMAQINREWNHSQGAGDPPLERKFIKPEVMIRVKCNIHRWMHAFIGVVDNPYFAVSKEDGSYTLPNLPPGTYTIEIWQENIGTQERQVTVAAHANTQENITFKGK